MIGLMDEGHLLAFNAVRKVVAAPGMHRGSNGGTRASPG